MKVYLLRRCCDISNAYFGSLYINHPHELTNDLNEADIICIIGCGYELTRINDTLESIYNTIKLKQPHAKLGVFGCPTKYVEFYNTIKNIPEIDYIGVGMGIDMQTELMNFLERELGFENVVIDSIGCKYTTPFRVNLVIEDGCDKRCTFCKSNYLDLHLKSMPFDHILKYLHYLAKYGLREVNITGLNTVDYGLDLYGKRRLTELIQAISKIPEIESIFIDSICLESMDDNLLQEIKNNKKIKRVMIPIQTMDNNILKLMNKRYTTEDIMHILSFISTNRPDIFLETIFMTTFPTETIETAERNIQLIEKIKIHNPVLSVYCQGNNVSTLKSENLPPHSSYERGSILDYYIKFMIPIIEEQRRKLLTNPLDATLVYSLEDYDIYSTLYRFTTNNLFVKCPHNSLLKKGDKVLLESDFVPSIPDYIYQTKRDEPIGRILKKVS